MNMFLHRLAAPIAVLTVASVAWAQHSSMPAGMTHEQHMAQMKTQGEKAMGFDQDTTVHHFRLLADGGSISVDVKTVGDDDTRIQIRSHLRQIATAFQQGDFAKPLMTHGEQPPGVAVLQRLKAELAYTYEDTARGGVVRIMTTNFEALGALHAFLKYQIVEHATGDPVDVSR